MGPKAYEAMDVPLQIPGDRSFLLLVFNSPLSWLVSVRNLESMLFLMLLMGQCINSYVGIIP